MATFMTNFGIFRTKTEMTENGQKFQLKNNEMKI